jgi:hypothetical protein
MKDASMPLMQSLLALTLMLSALLTGQSMIELGILALVCPILLWLMQKNDDSKLYNINSLSERHEHCSERLQRWFLFWWVTGALWTALAGLAMLNVRANRSVLEKTLGAEQAAGVVFSSIALFAVGAALLAFDFMGWLAFRRQAAKRIFFAGPAIGIGLLGVVGAVALFFQASSSGPKRDKNIILDLYGNPFVFALTLLVWVSFAKAAWQFLAADRRLAKEETQAARI